MVVLLGIAEEVRKELKGKSWRMVLLWKVKGKRLGRKVHMEDGSWCCCFCVCVAVEISGKENRKGKEVL